MLVASALSAPARAHAWPGENSLGKADAVVVVAASDDRYPFCSTVDVATARKMARERFPKARGAWIAASGRAMEVLADARWLDQLEKLWVCTDERGLRALARSGRLSKLIELQIASDDGEPLGGAAVRSLVQSRGLRGLERLRFSGGDSEAEKSIGSDGAVAIAEHTRLPHLRALDLSWQPIDKDGVAAIVRSKLAHQLDELNLCRTTVATDAVIDARLTNLVRLCISQGGAATDERARIDAAYPGVLSPQTEFLDEP
jgi:hypothetical protein